MENIDEWRRSERQQEKLMLITLNIYFVTIKFWAWHGIEYEAVKYQISTSNSERFLKYLTICMRSYRNWRPLTDIKVLFAWLFVRVCVRLVEHITWCAQFSVHNCIFQQCCLRISKAPTCFRISRPFQSTSPPCASSLNFTRDISSNQPINCPFNHEHWTTFNVGSGNKNHKS